MEFKNYIDLGLRISHFDDITHDEITQLVGKQPSKIHIKGDRRNPNNKNSPLIAVNNWILRSNLDRYSSFEDQMSYFLDLIEYKQEIFKKLSSKYYCEFTCAIFVFYNNGESTPWIHLDSRYNKVTGDINIEFDVDLYVSSKNDYQV